MSITHADGGNPNQGSGGLLRRQRERFAAAGGWPELQRKELTFGRFAIVHEPTGDEFRVYAGAIDLGPSHPIDAYYYDPAGHIVFLERLGGR